MHQRRALLSMYDRNVVASAMHKMGWAAGLEYVVTWTALDPPDMREMSFHDEAFTRLSAKCSSLKPVVTFTCILKACGAVRSPGL
jgi:hypothetical protein